MVTRSEEGLDANVSDDLLEEVILGMDNYLVGKFISFRPNIDKVCKWLDLVWKPKGSVTIV